MLHYKYSQAIQVSNMRPPRKVIKGKAECARCWQWKALLEFYPSKDSAIGLDSYCKICRRAIKSRAAKLQRLTKWFTKTHQQQGK